MHAYNGEVVFRGQADVAGNNVPGLWITDRTAAGTFKLGGSGNAAAAGACRAGFLPTNLDFTLFMGRCIFKPKTPMPNRSMGRLRFIQAGRVRTR